VPELELGAVDLDLNRRRAGLGDGHGSGVRLRRVRALAARRLLGRGIARRERLRHRAVVVSVLDAEGGKRLEEGLARLAERNAVLRAPRPGKAGLDGAEVEVDDLGIRRLDVLVVEEQLGAAVALDASNVLVASPRHA
jgi:hypothetical protein